MANRLLDQRLTPSKLRYLIAASSILLVLLTITCLPKSDSRVLAHGQAPPTTPYFDLAFLPSNITLEPNWTSYFAIVATSYNNFEGEVQLNWTYSSKLGIGPPSSIYVSAGKTSARSFDIVTYNSTPPGQYEINATGYFQGLSDSAVTQATVAPTYFPDFDIHWDNSVSFNSTDTPPSNLFASFYSQNGFNTTVSLQTIITPSGLAASTAVQSFELAPQNGASYPVNIDFQVQPDWQTPSGHYYVTMIAQGGGRTHSWTISIFYHFTPLPLFLYRLFAANQPVPGRPAFLVSNITNIGNVPVRMTEVTLVAYFGTFPEPVTPTIRLDPGQSRTFNFTITIPIGTAPRTYDLTLVVNWEYYYQSQWNAGPVGTVPGSIQVTSPTPSTTTRSSVSNAVTGIQGIARTFLNYWPFTLFAYLGVCSAVVALMLVTEQNRRSRL